MTIRFTEDLDLEGVRETSGGFLVASVKCARSGIQHYTARELGMDREGVVAVYRPETSVFALDSVKTFSGKPVTDDHPAEMVTAENWKQLAVGSIGEDVLRDGDFIRVPITIMDAATIAKVVDGKRQISMGYFADYKFESGTTPAGEPYEVTQENIQINHLAIVDRARAGVKCRIGDNAETWGAAPTTPTKDNDNMSAEQLQEVVLDGLSIKTTQQGAQAITKLTSDNKALQELCEEAECKNETAIAAKDTELAKKDAEIETLKKEAVDAEALDKMVSDRADLLTKAKALCKDADFSGKSDLSIKTEVVRMLHGEAAVADKSVDYISARFDVAQETVIKDPVRDAILNKDPVKIADNGQSAYEARLNGAWKKTNGGAN